MALPDDRLALLRRASSQADVGQLAAPDADWVDTDGEHLVIPGTRSIVHVAADKGRSPW